MFTTSIFITLYSAACRASFPCENVELSFASLQVPTYVCTYCQSSHSQLVLILISTPSRTYAFIPPSWRNWRFERFERVHGAQENDAARLYISQHRYLGSHTTSMVFINGRLASRPKNVHYIAAWLYISIIMNPFYFHSSSRHTIDLFSWWRLQRLFSRQQLLQSPCSCKDPLCEVRRKRSDGIRYSISIAAQLRYQLYWSFWSASASGAYSSQQQDKRHRQYKKLTLGLKLVHRPYGMWFWRL